MIAETRDIARVIGDRTRATVQDLADHIDHIVKIAGAEHVGLGSDLDGIVSTPEGLESVATYPRIFEELIRLR